MGGRGPSNESWFKDGIDMGKDTKVAKVEKNDDVKEFKDLFALADQKIKSTAQKKVNQDFVYNPIGSALPKQEPYK